jgi:hypothetical protein
LLATVVGRYDYQEEDDDKDDDKDDSHSRSEGVARGD